MFSVHDKPRDILNAAGSWLAAELGNGFRWVPSAHAIKVPIGGTTAEVKLRPSHWNYTGALTHALLRVTVRDKALAAWRRARGRNYSGVMSDPSADVVWSSELVNIYPDLQDVELFGDVAAATGSDSRFLTLSELLDAIRTRILPRLMLFQSPAMVAKELPDTWLFEEMGATAQWAISRGDEASAELLRARTLTLRSQIPATTELDAVLTAGRRLIAVLQSEMVHFREYRDGNLPDDLVSQGYELTRRWVVNLADFAGPDDRIADGELTDWATKNLPDTSVIGRQARAFETDASRLRSSRVRPLE
jgi:hypothetical protein